MKILGHIHTFNDDDVIDQSLGALLRQTCPADEVLIVDNGSTDNTLRRSFPDKVTVVRHPTNLGTSGAVRTGFQYALDHGYDWIWVLDADSVPRDDALEKLVQFHDSLSPELRSQTRIIASLPIESRTREPYHASVLHSRGMQHVSPAPGQETYEFDVAMWTGCLFRLETVRRLGLPSADYVLDMGENEYGYRGKRLGQRAFMHQPSIIEHNVGGQTSLKRKSYKLGPLSFSLVEFPPIRCYYVVRNTLFFWLYEYEYRNVSTVVPWTLFTVMFTLDFILRPMTHWRETAACLRGMWDGLFKNMHHRY